MSDLNLGTNPLNLAPSAIAVLALMDYGDGIERSWDSERKEYTADLIATPVYNCRERGYAVWDKTSKLAVIFCEHRNSDNIVISTFSWSGINPPTFQDFIDLRPDDDKWSMWDKSFSYHQLYQAADWILEQFEGQY